MAEAAARRGGLVPLTIVGGFLGAGKSSWLRHQLHVGRFGRAVVLVNEAADTAVDNLLLGRAQGLIVLAGGCACCEGLPALIAALRRFCDAQSATGALPVDNVILETSGLADPAPIAAAIAADPILQRRVRLAGILVLVDALHGLDQLAAEPLSRRQVASADQLVVTKADAAPPDGTARLVATLSALNPHAILSAAVLGEDAPLPDVTGVPPFPLPEVLDDGPLRPMRLDVGRDASWVALSAWLSALLHARGDQLVRVKGVMRTPAGRLLLQSVRRSVQQPEILPEPSDGTAPDDGVIVLFGRGFDEDLLGRSWRHFAG